MVSHVFAPGIGGTETVGRLLAEEFSLQGHDVRVITRTSGDSTHPFPVARIPGIVESLKLTRWAEVVFHNNISVRAAWPLMFYRRPWVVSYQTWVVGRLKRAVLGRASHISISRAVADSLPVKSRIIGNPYDANLFYVRRNIPRDRDLILVGRLVSDKGCDLFLEALEILEEQGVRPEATVVGDGPEREALERRAGGRVRFTGALTGEALATELNRHRVLVIPSRWNEPFGVVALEGIACGCVAVGSSGGGLAEAIGPCGRTFANGNARELAGVLREVLISDAASFTRHAEAHLKEHHPSVVAQKYLEVFRSAR